jgi:MFS family permease
MLGLSGYAIASWAPAHIQRNFDWSPALIGLALGVAIGVSGLVGTLVVGWLADRALSRGHRDAYFTTAIVTTVIGVPFIISAFLAADGLTCVILLGIGYLFLCSYGGICSAALQMMSPSHLRGRMSALYLFTVNILGLGLGPLVVGALTEHVFGDRMLVGYSVATTVSAAGLSSIICLLVGRKAYQNTISEIEIASEVHCIR